MEPIVVQMSPLELVEKTVIDPKLRGDEQWVDGSWVRAGSTVDDSYKRRRRSEYPPIGDQLDMLWQAMDEGVLPKVSRFYDLIHEVKIRNPK